tara:strand:+ start:79 stop:360 length:282 start_codon:yes stop_codon:yes gene_type:complete
MSQKYSIEIVEGTCYFCNKTFGKINNYTLKTDDTINICDNCYKMKYHNFIEDKIKSIKNYYTKYKISFEKHKHFITINEYRNIGYQDYNKLVK